ncbi:hypothetical protein BRO54_1733 [Geobacillus proteiniphilus]|uniref:Uncharacterized protein n=1 Tax=Geobacillus proteiniphilus TaxID=860353 RepID=A0A1Q5T1G4_9BACL|nr:hypothetical protein BRO54_1733 [Geobacillus proteiniphilus]
MKRDDDGGETKSSAETPHGRLIERRGASLELDSPLMHTGVNR